MIRLSREAYSLTGNRPEPAIDNEHARSAWPGSLVSGLLIACPGQIAERFPSIAGLTDEVVKRSMLPFELALVLALLFAALIRESHPRLETG
jgi:hypothetical protein